MNTLDMPIDYATPAERLHPPVRCRCNLCTDGTNAALADEFRRGGRPTTASGSTDVRETYRRWAARTGGVLPSWMEPALGSDLPALVRRQA